MGTRMVSAPRVRSTTTGSKAVLAARETDTVFLNRHTKPALRALRTERTTALEFDTESNAMALFGRAMDLYFGGDMEAAIALSGQVAGRIEPSSPWPTSSTAPPSTASPSCRTSPSATRCIPSDRFCVRATPVGSLPATGERVMRARWTTAPGRARARGGVLRERRHRRLIGRLRLVDDAAGAGAGDDHHHPAAAVPGAGGRALPGHRRAVQHAWRPSSRR